MTMVDEDQLRRALDEAVRDVATTDGAWDRLLDAARGELGPLDDETSAEHDDEHGELDGEEPEGPRHRSHRLPLAVAASALVAVALTLAATAIFSGGPSSTGNALSGHTLGGIASPSNGATWSAIGAPQSNLGFRAAQGTALGVIDANGVSTSKGTGPMGATGAGTQPAKVVATGTVALTVPSSHVAAVLASLTSVVTADGGYVSSSNAHAAPNGSTASATIVLRVPEHRFGSLVTRVQRYGRVKSVVTSSADVTGQYVNYNAHIAALEASRQQYLTIMAKATSIPDILSIQSQINQIQSEIDQFEGARNVLVNEAAYSSLTVSLNPGLQATAARPSSLSKAFHDSVRGFVGGFEGLVRAAGPVLFALLCLAVLFLLGRLGWRAARRRML